MGVTTVDNILMILGVSLQMNEHEREVVTREIMKGFNSKAIEAGTIVTGGQSVMNPWPMIGGTAISVVKKSSVIYPNNAKIGDKLILTKPLGTQVAVNLAQWLLQSDHKWIRAKEFVTEEDVWDAYSLAEISMSRLNKNAATIMKKFKVGCCTDVTGFGITGHAENLLVAQKNKLKFRINKLPIIGKMDIINKKIFNFKLTEGYSAETSGGLLIAIDKLDADSYIEEMKKIGEWSWIIGDVIDGDREVELSSSLEYIYV